MHATPLWTPTLSCAACTQPAACCESAVWARAGLLACAVAAALARLLARVAHAPPACPPAARAHDVNRSLACLLCARPLAFRLVEDTAWHPVTEAEMAKWSPGTAKFFKVFLGTPLKLWASVGHWLIWHFDLEKYTEKQRPRVIISLAVVYGFMATALVALTWQTGVWGLIKYWLMPWLGYHFWMSTFTVIHHTAPHIAFKPASEWNAAKAQLSGTVHCDFPGWVDFLTHDISWHVPHHVSTKIPWYNLRMATESLRTNWGQVRALPSRLSLAPLRCRLRGRGVCGVPVRVVVGVFWGGGGGGCRAGECWLGIDRSVAECAWSWTGATGVGENGWVCRGQRQQTNPP